MGVDLNMDFLGGLAQKTNYANLMAQKQQIAEANKARELQSATMLNNFQERDTNNALNLLERQDKAEQDIANLPISEYDKKKLMEEEASLRDKHLTPLIDKYKGNVLDLLKSDEGKTATMRYMNGLRSNPNIPIYKRDAALMAENEKRIAMGYEPLAVYRPETKQWYNPEEQVKAKEAGLIPNLEAHPFIKPSGFDAMKYFQSILPPTDKEDEYYKLKGRMTVSPDIYARELMAKHYSTIPVNTPRYQEYYNKAKEFYQNQSTPLYYKVPVNEEEIAKVKHEREMRGYYEKEAYKQSLKDVGNPQPNDFEATPFKDVSAIYKDSRNKALGVNKYDLAGTEMSMPLLPSNVPTTAVKFYIPSNRIKSDGNQKDANGEYIPKGEEIVEQGETIDNAKVIIPKNYKLRLLPVGQNNQTPNPYSKTNYAVFVTAVSGEGGDAKVGYIPFSAAESIINKAGYNYKKAYDKLHSALPTEVTEEVKAEEPIKQNNPSPQPTTTKKVVLTKGSLNDL
jgi:hypothetical protein